MLVTVCTVCFVSSAGGYMRENAGKFGELISKSYIFLQVVFRYLETHNSVISHF